MSVAVVVDGGGSGCRLAAYDAHGTLCATAANGPASLSLGEEQAWLHISRGLQTLADQLGEPTDWLPPALCMGLSGALQESRRERFLALLPTSIDCTLVTDGHAQLLGASGGQRGACLAVGTGSVLHWRDEAGEFGMAGGWGYPVGDEASGAWLGMQLINAYLWHCDSAEHTDKPADSVAPVFVALQERIGSSVSRVQAWSTSTRSTEMASLAPMIVAAAEQGDTVAMTILDTGVAHCKRLLSIAPEGLPVYLVGGLADVYRSRLGEPLRDRLREPQGDALSGLYSLVGSSNPGSSRPGSLLTE
jgi:glucosamine kinase